MSSLLLSKNEQGIVIFHIWKSLTYKARLGLSVLLILSGLVLQFEMFHFFPGALLVLIGNLLLLVKGYDTRTNLKSFKHDAEWVPTSEDQLVNIISLYKKMRSWDRSALDITSGLGFLVFFIFLVIIVLLFALHPFSSFHGTLIVAINVAILLIPHWFTGTKRITTDPKLENKMKLYLELMKNFKETLREDTIKYLMLIQESNEKIPLDVKMQIKFKNQPDDFLGVYAQIALNNVQGADYPYFYVVLVAKENSTLLGGIFDSLEMPDQVLKELKRENEVEIIVIRQVTTKTSGYHTNAKAMAKIFETGILSARKIIPQQ